MTKHLLRRPRWFLAAVGGAVAVVVVAAPAVACGGLVGENGSIQLTRTTTLAAYHDGETLTGLVADPDGRWVERRSGGDPDLLAAELLSLVPATIEAPLEELML